MKNLLIAFFLLISASSFAQTTYTFATYSSTTTGDLRGGFVSTQTGKKVPSAQIQADQGLN